MSEKTFRPMLTYSDEAQHIGPQFINDYYKNAEKQPTNVLFIASMHQCISMNNHDFIDEVDRLSSEIQVGIKKYDLNANVRYSGGGSGIRWIAHQLQIFDTGNYEEWDADAFSISILENPSAIQQVLNQQMQNGQLCRVISQRNDEYITFKGSEIKIPIINEKSPNATRWLTDEKLYDCAVNVKLLQGLELDYACVVIDDITIDAGAGKIQFKEEIQRKILEEVSEKGFGGATENILSNYLSNILRKYYISFSRARKGIYIYCNDEKLKKFLSEKILHATRRYAWIKDFISQYSLDSEKGIIKKENGEDVISASDDKYAYVKSYRILNGIFKNIKIDLEKDIDDVALKRICDSFSKELIELQKIILDDSYETKRYKESIVANMGLSAWGKLSDSSKKYLLSAEIMFNDLKNYNQLVDFSGVCVQVSKAVEFELTDRYFNRYIDYLSKKYGEELQDRIPKTLLSDNGEIKGADKYTLGDVRFTLGMDAEGNIKNNYAYRQFSYYAEDCMLKNGNSAQKTLAAHVRIIQKIKDDYRNKAAHKSEIDIITARECIDYVIEAERKLGIMLDAYEY